MRPPWNASLPERYRAHAEIGGYASPPGPAASWWRRAEIERAAVRAGYYLEIVRDVVGDRDDPDNGPHFGAILTGPGPDEEDVAVASLWAIDAPPSDPYYRVVFAELAEEIREVILP